MYYGEVVLSAEICSPFSGSGVPHDPLSDIVHIVEAVHCTLSCIPLFPHRLI